MDNLTVRLDNLKSDGSEFGDFILNELGSSEAITSVGYFVSAFLQMILFSQYHEFLLKKICGNPDNAGMRVGDVLKKLPPITTSLIRSIIGCSEEEALYILQMANKYSRKEMITAYVQGDIDSVLFWVMAVLNTEPKQAQETN